MKPLRRASAIALILVASVTFANPMLAQRGTLLRLKLRKGQQYAFTVTTLSKIGGAPQGFTSSRSMSLKVLSASANKNRVEMTLSAMSLNGKASGQPTTIESTVDGRGRLIGELTMNGEPATVSGGIPGMENPAFFFSFPEAPVQVGTTWTFQVDLGKTVSGLLGGKATGSIVPIVYRVKKIARAGRQTLVTIGSTMKGNISVSTPNGAGSTRIVLDIVNSGVVDAATGVLVSMAGGGKVGATIGQTHIDQNVTISIKRK
jgi:hypothetical protein